MSFTNTGTLNVQTGTLSLYGMTLTNSGKINESGTSTLQINSGATLANAATGVYTWSGGTLDTTNGMITNTGTITVSGTGTATETLLGTFTNAGNINQTGTGTSSLAPTPR